MTLKVTRYRKTFRDGSLRPIHGKITIFPADRDTQGPRHGLLQATFSQSGSRLDQVPFCGFTANVSTRSARMFIPELMVFPIRSGRREERLLVRRHRKYFCFQDS
jgi:hypothetical protein